MEDLGNFGALGREDPLEKEMAQSLGQADQRRAWQPIPVFLPGEFHGQRSLEGHYQRGHKELDTTEVWRKGNPLTLLVGMQTSTATMENSVEIP